MKLVAGANALIQAARISSGLTQVEAAKKAGTSQTAWSRTEHDADLLRMQLGTVLRILDAVGLKAKDIISL